MLYIYSSSNTIISRKNVLYLLLLYFINTNKNKILNTSQLKKKISILMENIYYICLYTLIFIKFKQFFFHIKTNR